MLYTSSLTAYERLKTVPVTVGDLVLGGEAPIRVQTMTTFDTMDTAKTVAQSIRCIEAGSELIRITAPSKTEAENLLNIKNEIRKRGYRTPIVADIHFTPNAAEIAARIVEKVRVNPGNYADKKKFGLSADAGLSPSSARRAIGGRQHGNVPPEQPDPTQGSNAAEAAFRSAASSPCRG